MTAPATSCPSCGSSALEEFHRQENVPTNSCLLLRTRPEALNVPRGDIRLELCRSCGFVANTAFRSGASRYESSYEETQGFSPRFRGFAWDLARQWVEAYDIRGRDIIEIGCGKGEFLTLICEAGANRGVGIDPSWVDGRIDPERTRNITFIPDFYGERFAHLPADVIVCRHTLEHIPDVSAFLGLVRRVIGARLNTVVLFEVPDVTRILEEIAFWDVYYEHCSYFSVGSLVRLFRRCGFDVLDAHLEFDGQYIVLAAVPRPPNADPNGRAPKEIEGEDDLVRLTEGAAGWRSGYRYQVARWRDLVEAAAAGRSTTVIWGAGSKGVAFLTSVEADSAVAAAVDVNPYKQGMYMAGTGHCIVAPERLGDIRPETVIVMNPTYLGEIGADLDSSGVAAKLLAV
ncbi:MAG: class I SAM-dependent methyltransferase [Acidimicrobiales bacterium]